MQQFRTLPEKVIPIEKGATYAENNCCGHDSYVASRDNCHKMKGLNHILLVIAAVMLLVDIIQQ